jgi:hypothetical protein
MCWYMGGNVSGGEVSLRTARLPAVNVKF